VGFFRPEVGPELFMTVATTDLSDEVPTVAVYWTANQMYGLTCQNLWPAGETAEYDVFDLMEVEHLAELSQLHFVGVLCQISRGSGGSLNGPVRFVPSSADLRPDRRQTRMECEGRAHVRRPTTQAGEVGSPGSI